MEAGYHHAALKMSEKESWKIVKKCHRHYELLRKVRSQIHYFKRGKS